MVSNILLVGVIGCSSISTVRIQPESVYVGPNLRPIALIHAQVTSAYLLFIPIPGDVSLDRVVNRMLLATAKALGADKVVNIRVDITPEHGVWALRKLFWYRSAEASGVAVMVEPDPAKSPAMNRAMNRSIGDRGRAARPARRDEGRYQAVATKPAGMARPRGRSIYSSPGPERVDQSTCGEPEQPQSDPRSVRTDRAGDPRRVCRSIQRVDFDRPSEGATP